MNERDPLNDRSVCYVDVMKGVVVGGIGTYRLAAKAERGSIVRMTVDFDLGLVWVWIGEQLACVVHLTEDLLNKPHALYPCVLFSQHTQSFTLRSCVLNEGHRLGDVLGGDFRLRESLNRLSDMYLLQKDKYQTELEEREDACKQVRVGAWFETHE